MTVFPRLAGLVLGACVFTANTASAGEWTWLTPTPPPMSEIFFVNKDTGWGVGTNNAATVIRTTDGGATWRPLRSFVSPYRLQTAFFIDGQTGWVAGENAHISKTANGGLSWTAQLPGTPVPSGSSDGWIQKIHFINRDTGWAVGVHTILRTTNGGTTWTSTSAATTHFLDVFFKKSGTGWAVGVAEAEVAHPTIWSSTNFGQTWTPMVASEAARFFTLIRPSGGDTVWAAGSRILYRTLNGTDWTPHSTHPDLAEAAILDLKFEGSRTGTIVSNTASYKTTDGGTSWTKTPFSQPQPGSYATLLNPDTAWGMGDYGQVVKTVNGGANWSALTSIPPRKSGSMGFFKDTLTGWTPGDSGSIWKTTNGGDAWAKQTTPAGSSTLRDLKFVGDTGYAAGGSGVIKSVDGGATWTATTRPTTSTLTKVFFVNGRTGWVLSWGPSVHKTTDGGLTWTTQSVDASGTSLSDIQFITPERGWISLENGYVLRTTNGGANWTKIRASTDPAVFLGGIHFLDSLTGWVAALNSSVKTTDGGLTWSVGLAGKNEVSKVQFVDAQHGWLTGGHGGYKTTDGGATWTPTVTHDQHNIVYMDINHGWAFDWNGGILRYNDTLRPAPPALLQPAANAQNLPLSLTLTWSARSSAIAYHVQLAADSLFNTLIVDDPSLTLLQKGVGPLALGTTYYWRMRARNPVGLGAWGETRRITLAPATPTLLEPASNASAVPVSGNLSWSMSSPAATYQVQLANDSSFATPTLVINDATVTSPSRAYGPLGNITTYYWRVNAKNAGGTSPYSPVRKFITELPPVPGVPVLASPAHLATGTSLSPTLAWNADSRAAGYRLQVASDSAFTSLVVHDSTLTLAPTQRTVGPLLPGVTYHWRASASNLGGTSAFSAPWRFTTLALPDSARTLFPAFADTVKQDSVALRWRRANPAVTRYHLLTASDSGFTAAVALDSSLTDTAKIVKALANNSAVWWKVKACNASGCAPYGRAAMFRVSIPPAALLANGVRATAVHGAEGHYVLFTLPAATEVRIRALDARGRRAVQILDETREAGSHRVALPKSLRASYVLIDFRAGAYRKTLRLQP